MRTQILSYAFLALSVPFIASQAHCKPYSGSIIKEVYGLDEAEYHLAFTKPDDEQHYNAVCKGDLKAFNKANVNTPINFTEYSVESGGMYDHTTNYQSTPLFVAIDCLNFSSFATLLKLGADPYALIYSEKALTRPVRTGMSIPSSSFPMTPLELAEKIIKSGGDAYELSNAKKIVGMLQLAAPDAREYGKKARKPVLLANKRSYIERLRVQLRSYQKQLGQIQGKGPRKAKRRKYLNGLINNLKQQINKKEQEHRAMHKEL